MTETSATQSNETVTIQPGVAILSVLQHLNYQPWYAIAEFVDNSLQSFLSNRDQLVALHGPDIKCQVDIILSQDPPRLTIRDNAAGIPFSEFPRAFRPAALPDDRTGLSEFGMGMKSAACWFAPHWSVRTTAIGDPLERVVRFNIEQIVRDDIRELTIASASATARQHFTEIVMTDLHRCPKGATVHKIKEHLASIFRVFLRDGTLELVFQGSGRPEPLSYAEVPILNAPLHSEPDGDSIVWRKPIDLDFGGSHRVTGFAALRETGSTSHAGFALLRRNRLIQGSGDDAYRPHKLFGASTTYIYQRLFGELNLEGFDVSHTKDGFEWDEGLEDLFLDFLKEQLDEGEVPLLEQARYYRSSRNRSDMNKAAQKATARTMDAVEQNAPAVIEAEMLLPPVQDALPEQLPEHQLAASQERTIQVGHDRWVVTVELSNDPAVGDWLEIRDTAMAGTGQQPRKLGIRLSLAHPFMQRYCGLSTEEVEPIVRISVAIALAEVVARDSGIQLAGTFRRAINDLLRDALAC